MARVTIHKYDIGSQKMSAQGTIEVLMPADAQVLSAHNQFGKLIIWAKVPSDEPAAVYRRLLVVGTGQQIDSNETEMPNGAEFVGTVLFNQGSTVLHVFDLGEKH